MKKRILSILMSLALVFVMAGCGGGDTTSSEATDGKADAFKGGITTSDPSGEDNSNSSDEYTSSDEHTSNNSSTTVVTKKDYTVKAKGSKYADGIMLPKLSQKEATITYMTNTTWEFIQQESTETSPTAIYHAMKVWKETYGVDVKIEMVGWGEFTSHLMSSVVAGEGPDIMRWVSGRPKWISNNLVMPLDGKLDFSDSDYDVNKMNQSYSMNGHIYAAQAKGMKMPEFVIAYNKTKFNKAGELDPMTLYKSGKWTFSQFIKTAKNMTDEANNEYGVASPGGLLPAMFNLMNLENNGKVTLNITNNNFVKCMQSMWKLYQVEKAGRRADAQLSDFPLGRDAMYPVQTKEYCRMMDIAKKNGVSDKFGIAPYPSYDMIGQTKPFGRKITYADAFCVSSVPKNVDGALEFVRLVTKIGSNISEELGDWGWAKSHMSAEEKSVFSKIEYFDWNKEDCTGSIDGVESVYVSRLKIPIFYTENPGKELSSILADSKSALEGAIKEYEISAGLRK